MTECFGDVTCQRRRGWFVSGTNQCLKRALEKWFAVSQDFNIYCRDVEIMKNSTKKSS